MSYTLEKYIAKTKELLKCNGAGDDDSQQCYYSFTNKQIDDNHIYFKRLKKNGMSPYKALLYFNDYLEGHEVCCLNVKPINNPDYEYSEEDHLPF